jgi:hypothetical protein
MRTEQKRRVVLMGMMGSFVRNTQHIAGHCGIGRGVEGARRRALGAGSSEGYSSKP